MTFDLQLGYNLLYRWFVGLSMDDAAWDHSTYTRNRDRLIEHDIEHDMVRGLFGQVMQQAKEPTRARSSAGPPADTGRS